MESIPWTSIFLLGLVAPPCCLLLFRINAALRFSKNASVRSRDAILRSLLTSASRYVVSVDINEFSLDDAKSNLKKLRQNLYKKPRQHLEAQQSSIGR